MNDAQGFKGKAIESSTVPCTDDKVQKSKISRFDDVMLIILVPSENKFDMGARLIDFLLFVWISSGPSMTVN